MRFREDGRGASELATGGHKTNNLGAPAVTKQTKPWRPSAGPSRKPVVVPMPSRKQINSDFGGHTLGLQAPFFFSMDFMDETPLVARAFTRF